MLTKKQIRYSFNRVLMAAENIKCDDLHHKKTHQHEHDELCKAEYELQKHCHIVREYMREKNI